MRNHLLSGRQLTSNELEQYSSEGLHIESITVPAVIKKGGKIFCQRCSNNHRFAQIPNSQTYYCLNCIGLGRVNEVDLLHRFPAKEKISQNKNGSLLKWSGNLSHEQERASKELLESLKNIHQIHIIQAVTGAGKTEIVFQTLDEILSKGGRTAVVSPRIDVCLELAPRLRVAFPEVDIMVMYGQTDEKFRYTKMVVSTIHQLWKFYQAFDLIIVDEVDAFPLAGDESLHFAVKQALKDSGKLIYLTATPDNYLRTLIRKKRASVTILPARYHRCALPEPRFVWIGDWKTQIQEHKEGILLKKLKLFLMNDGIKLVFMPNIPLAEKLYQWLLKEKIAETLEVVHAKDPLRKAKVQKVRDGEVNCLITTTILERGVTFTNCHVFIIGAEDKTYSISAIVQMSGRVGRKADFSEGSLIFGHFGVSWRMIRAQSQIKQMNRLARKQGLLNE